MRRFVGYFLFALILGRTAEAAAPNLTSVSPRGAQRGRTVNLTLVGDGVGTKGAEILTSLPGGLGAVAVSSPNSLTVPVSISAETQVGFYPLRVRTADGLTNSVLISITDLPEVAEQEPNDERSTAQALTAPVVVQGACAGTDIDHFRFTATKGQPLVIETEARRLGSGIDPALVIFDRTGRQLGADFETIGLPNGDVRLIFQAPTTGEYVVALSDVKYAAGGDPFYRLKIGPYEVVEAMFPLGWRRGEPVEVLFLNSIRGENRRLSLQTPTDPDLAWFPVASPDAGIAAAMPFRMILGDAPEQLEPEADGVRPLTPGVVMNGRISRPGEVDRYQVRFTPGQPLAIDVAAARLGSKLDAVLKIARADGSIVAAADDSQGLDPSLPLDAKDLTISVEDLLGRGGPSFAYRLTARPVAPDFSISVAVPAVNIPRGAIGVIPVRVSRQNFNEPIQLSIPSDTPGVTASGGLIPAGAVEGSIILSGSRDADTKMVPLAIWGEGGPAAQPLRRRARLAADGTTLPPMRPTDIPAAIGNGPSVSLAASATSLTLPHGQDVKLVIKADRAAGGKQPITITATGFQPQVAVAPLTIAADKAEGALSFNADSLTKTGPFTLTLTAKTTANGREEVIALPPIPASVERPYSLEIQTPSVSLKPGEKATIVGVLRRVAPFDGPVKVAHEGGLPPHIAISTATIPPGSSSVLLEASAGADANAGAFDLNLRASTEMPGRKNTKDYVIPDVPVRVTLTKK